MAKKTIFERNPKKTSAIFFLVVMALFIFGVEKFFNAPHIVIVNKGEQRYIRLREHGPGFHANMIPDADYLKTVDGLAAKSYLLRTDNDGFIMPTRVYLNPDLTIAFLGGSTTECAFVDESLRYPYLVGKWLGAATGLKINSYNAGMSGNNTMHSIDILLNKVLALKPDIVIMMENINDVVMLLIEKSYWSNNPSRSLIVEKHFSLAEVIAPAFNTLLPNLKQYMQTRLHAHADEFQGKRGSKIQIQKETLLNEFRMNLQLFIAICNIRKITPVLMTQENRFKTRPDPVIAKTAQSLVSDYGLSYAEFKDLIDAFNETIRTIGKENHVLVIDLAKAIPPTNTYIYDTVHVNNQGSQLAAQTITAALQPVVSAKLFADRMPRKK